MRFREAVVPRYLVRSAGANPDCEHVWSLAGATTASDGYTCKNCGGRVEVFPDDTPPRTGGLQ